MKIEFLLVVTFVLFGCASVHYEYQKATISELRSGFEDKTSIAPTDAITTSINKGTLLKEQHIYFVNTQTADRVRFDTYSSPSLVAQLDKPTSQITIKSYVVKPDNGEQYLFYPVITSFDSNFNKIAEILPQYEFVFNENVLTNTFRLPSKVKYILIHSKSEFLGMEFMDSWSESPGHPSEALPVLGGVIGSALYASMSAKQAIDYNNLKSFSFASGGAISWSSN